MTNYSNRNKIFKARNSDESIDNYNQYSAISKADELEDFDTTFYVKLTAILLILPLLTAAFIIWYMLKFD